MTVGTSSQLTIDFEPGLTERHSKLMDCIREVAYSHRNPLKTIAFDMDMSQSELSRKLAQNPGDVRHFTVDDFERFLEITEDTRPIKWLIEKFLEQEEDKQKRVLSEIAKHLPEFMSLLKQIKVDE